MSKLLITKKDVRNAVVQYYSDYEPDLFKKFDFETIQTYVGGNKDNLIQIDFEVEEKE